MIAMIQDKGSSDLYSAGNRHQREMQPEVAAWKII
jgi:hypothetical protein